MKMMKKGKGGKGTGRNIFTFHSWLKIIRLQFYPMAWIVYSLGAAAAYVTFGKFDSTTYWLGYIILFLIELGSVLANEYYDFNTDMLNKNAGPFNGGSRVLVEGKIEPGAVKSAIFAILFLILTVGYALMNMSPASHSLLIFSLILIGLFLGLGYTTPPLKFCYRTLGELVVGITFSPYLILCGYAFQCGQWQVPLPWLLSIPLFFAIFAAITLSGIPDFQADRMVSKKTIAVTFGPLPAIVFSACSVSLAAISWAAIYYFKLLKGMAGAAISIVTAHALVLLWALFKLTRGTENPDNRKINTIMWLSLSYISWFGFIPLLSFIL